MKKCLIVCSGGLDSTSMALVKVAEGHEVELITFNYGQKASNEIKRSQQLSKRLGIVCNIIDVSSLKFIFGEGNQLTNDSVKVESNFKGSVVVPLRNSLFVNLSYIYAMTHNFDEVILGSHLDDITLDEHGEYMFPDCSPEFFKSLNTSYGKGRRKEDYPTAIVSASMLGFYKADLIKKAYSISPEILFNSWSCYLTDTKQCGECDSCKNRRNAFLKAGIEDLTEYSAL